MNQNTTIGLVVLAAVVVIGIVWYATNTNQPEVSVAPEATKEEQMASESPMMESPTVSVEPTRGGAMQAVAKEFTVTGSNFTFDPAQIRVKVGDTVRITFKNSGGAHNWRLDEFNAKTNVIQGGEQETIEFVANKAGQFEYYCSVGNHRQMGMKGTLVVE